MRSALIVLLTVLRSSVGDYPCICNYAVDTPVYRDSDTSTSVISHMYEFSCSPTYSATVNSNPKWQAVIKDHQIGYVQLNSNLDLQTCFGAPDPVDTVTAGVTTPSTVTSSTGITSTTSRLTSSTTRPFSTVSPTTPKQGTATRTAASSSSLPTVSNTPVSTSLTSTPSTSTQKTTVQVVTNKPKALSTKIVTSTPRATTLPPPTTQPSTPPSTTTQRPATHMTVTQPHHVSTPQYHCPLNAVLAAQQNHGVEQVHGNSCYELVPAKASWQYAEQNCQHKGGHLVHMSNPDDEKFVMQFLWSHNYNKAVWIGLNDIGYEEHFKWSSGDSFVYAKWMPGRQSNFLHHYYEDCVVLVPYIHAGFMQTFGQWDDVHCQQPYPWICRYDSHSSYGGSHTTLAPVINFLSHLFGRQAQLK